MLKFYILWVFILFSSAFVYSNSCQIEIEGESWICSGQTTILTATAGFSEYYWSNGRKGPSISVEPGFYRVVGRTEDGCVSTAGFFVGTIPLPQTVSMLGTSRVEGENWVDIRYAIYPYNEQLEYSWMLDGDTIAQGQVLEIDSLPIATYQLSVEAYSPCSSGGASVSSYSQLWPFGDNPDTARVYSCSMEPPYYYYGVPFYEPGLHDVRTVNQYGWHIGFRRYLQVAPQYEESYDTITLCGGAPLSYYGTTISQPGSYDIPKRSFFGCTEMVHLEVLGPFENAVSLEALVRCSGGWFEHNGQTYSSPGFYQRSYPLPNGCDSLVYTFVEYFYETPQSEVFAEICPRDSFHHDGVYYAESGTYTRTYLMENGCDSIVNIIVQQANPIEISNQWILPDGGNETGAIALTLLGGNPPYVYEWSNGANTRDISQLSAGTYSLTVTDGLGCTASFTFDLGLLSGLSDQPAGDRLTLGPNPFQDKLQVYSEATGAIPDPALYLYDATGRLALRAFFSNGLASVPPALPAGLYWYRLESAGELLSAGKIVRQ